MQRITRTVKDRKMQRKESAGRCLRREEMKKKSLAIFIAILAAMSIVLAAVSYTHLDVYKRQDHGLP